MNKKGTDKTLSVYWFAIFFITAAAVIYMVGAFYNHPYEVRELEADILANKVVDCVSRQGKINEDFFTENFEDVFLSECSLNFETEDFWEEQQYYVGVWVFDISDLENPVIFLEAGNSNFVSSCEIEDEDYNKLAKCVEKRFYVVQGEKQFLVKVLSIVRKTEKNVK